MNERMTRIKRVTYIFMHMRQKKKTKPNLTFGPYSRVDCTETVIRYFVALFDFRNIRTYRYGYLGTYLPILESFSNYTRTVRFFSSDLEHNNWIMLTSFTRQFTGTTYSYTFSVRIIRLVGMSKKTRIIKTKTEIKIKLVNLNLCFTLYM